MASHQVHSLPDNFRSDVAAVLPGYQNSNGAVGFKTLDTTTLTSGQHTLSWSITDNNNQTASAREPNFHGAGRNRHRRAAEEPRGAYVAAYRDRHETGSTIQRA